MATYFVEWVMPDGRCFTMPDGTPVPTKGVIVDVLPPPGSNKPKEVMLVRAVQWHFSPNARRDPDCPQPDLTVRVVLGPTF